MRIKQRSTIEKLENRKRRWTTVCKREKSSRKTEKERFLFCFEKKKIKRIVTVFILQLKNDGC